MFLDAFQGDCLFHKRAKASMEGKGCSPLSTTVERTSVDKGDAGVYDGKRYMEGNGSKELNV